MSPSFFVSTILVHLSSIAFIVLNNTSLLYLATPLIISSLIASENLETVTDVTPRSSVLHKATTSDA